MAEDQKQEPQEPIVEEKRRLSLVWLMPLVALCVAGWLGWQAWQERGVKITLQFDNGTGIVAGRTHVRYNGLEVGMVESVSMRPDLKGVEARVSMNKEVSSWLTDKTEFWLVKPEISLAGISGIEALLSGNYITFKPEKGRPAHHFIALDDPPPLAEGKAGLHITLSAPDGGSLIAGSPVYSKHIYAGEVERVTLKDDGKSVQVDIFIEPDYEHLVHTNTRFWNVSGVHVSGSISNLHLQTGSLLSILKGGIAFTTPEWEAPQKQAVQKEQFPLYSDYEAARAGVSITIEFPLSAHIVQKGAHIMFHGVEAGVVKSYDFKEDLSGFSVVVSMDPQATPALVEGAKFWLVEPHITPQGIEGLETLLSGRYIAMDITDTAIKRGESKRLFRGSLRKPPPGPDVPGLHLQLTTDDVEGLSEGSGVWMRGVKIGSVESIELQSSAVNISILIEPQYAHFIRSGVRCWKTSGISVSGGLSGFHVQSQPLGAMISGGLTCEVPDSRAQREKNGRIFPLYSTREQAFKQGRHFKLIAANKKSIDAGTAILYHGEKVGEVERGKLGNPADRVEIDIIIYSPYEALVTENSRFWSVSGLDVHFSAFRGIEIQTPTFESMIRGGIAFATPEVAEPASECASFILHGTPKDEWEHWNPPIYLKKDLLVKGAKKVVDK
ncbi:MlaD family protein [Parendozoicomonas sp. Alg238-R29]|uniref:PqiB family protein n=1 Tax=Parendozoicomonas sp. Alg238-R29 TaxID=2993446 RepID=UPI00248D90E6|nr:MlaD family protein [Parendozoicomonas sp. Alg238-R29]